MLAVSLFSFFRPSFKCAALAAFRAVGRAPSKVLVRIHIVYTVGRCMQAVVVVGRRCNQRPLLLLLLLLLAPTSVVGEEGKRWIRRRVLHVEEEEEEVGRKKGSPLLSLFP